MGITAFLAAELPDVSADDVPRDVIVSDGHGYLVLDTTHALV